MFGHSGFTAASLGYLYKNFIPVYSNRPIESSATLYDSNNVILMTFPARKHGYNESTGVAGNVGNQFTANGNTVTGLVEVDLNSPKPDPAKYSPWPIN
jgi:hypothetical protein